MRRLVVALGHGTGGGLFTLDTLLAMPMILFYAWADALMELRGHKGLHVSTEAAEADPSTIELPPAVQAALARLDVGA